MKLKKWLIVYPAALGVMGAAIVACGPQKTSVPIQNVVSKNRAQSFGSCYQKVERTRNSVRIAGNRRSVTICEVFREEEKIGDDQLAPWNRSSSATAKAPARTDFGGRAAPTQTAAGSDVERLGYQKVTHELSYNLQSIDSVLTLQLNLGIDLPKKTDAEAIKRAHWIMRSLCLPKINEVFARSTSGQRVAVSIKLNQFVPADPTKPETTTNLQALDQVLHFVPVNDPTVPEGTALAMAQWPDRGIMRTLEQASTIEDCSKLGEGKAADCRYRAFDEANIDFCADLSLMVGHWLGLESSDELNKPCDGKPNSPNTNAAFMKASHSAGRGAEFFAKAQFSPDDLKAILNPACDAVPSVTTTTPATPNQPATPRAPTPQVPAGTPRK